MPSGKARFRGDTRFEHWPKFSDKLRGQLAELYPRAGPKCSVGARSEADRFVDDLLQAAELCLSDLVTSRSAMSQADLLAEHRIIKARLRDCIEKLRALSFELDGFLPPGTDVKGTADSIALLLSQFEESDETISVIPAGVVTREHRERSEFRIAKKLAVDVLRAAKPHGVVLALSDGGQYGSEGSLSLRILKLIGDDIGLKRDVKTWRRIAAEAKRTNRR